MSISKPYAPACDRNKEPILEVLREKFRNTHDVLEIGSGTGQHAVYFAKAMPWLVWRTSDLAIHHPGISAWVTESCLENVRLPRELDVKQEIWPIETIDGIFSANTVHIMSWRLVINLFEGVGRVLKQSGIFCLYGPFNYNNNYTSKSNADFDLWLKHRDPLSGIRDFEKVRELASEIGLNLTDDYEMPSNNRLLVWQNLDSKSFASNNR